MLRAMRLAIGLLLVMDAVASWSYTYGDFWVVSGLLLAMSRVSSSAANTVEATNPDRASAPLAVTLS